MKRRDFLAGGILAVAMSPALGEGTVNNPRLAIYSPSEPGALMHERSENRYYRALFEELRRLGHVEGQNLTIERYGKEKGSAGAGALAADVVRSNPDVVYVVGPGAMFFKRETKVIPIVALTGDPVAMGLVETLARPGGNITGVSVDAGRSGLPGKRLELLREMFPGMLKIGHVTLRVAAENGQAAAMRTAAESAGVELVESFVEFPASETDYRNAIEYVSSQGANAIMVGDNPDTMTNRSLIANLIAAAKLPAMYPISECVHAGGLMAYSFDLVGLNERVANDIDAILRGTKPADIPYFQSSKFELSINLKTAEALGLTVPPTLLSIADEVIE
jgi:putative tryptophan/tyrosine transport system substrate-binding protein